MPSRDNTIRAFAAGALPPVDRLMPHLRIGGGVNERLSRKIDTRLVPQSENATLFGRAIPRTLTFGPPVIEELERSVRTGYFLTKAVPKSDVNRHFPGKLEIDFDNLGHLRPIFELTNSRKKGNVPIKMGTN